MAEYLFQGTLVNTVHDISYEQIKQLYKDNLREEAEGRRVTQSSYRGENYYTDKNLQAEFDREVLYRDPLTAGMRVQYPHGVIIQQSQRRNFYRGENQQYEASVPSLLRTLNNPENGYITRKEKELYRLVADMRIAEFTMLLQKFEHVNNWNICDVLYDVLAQHYGLETGWLDITSNFNVALFFATCTYDNGKWRPLTKSDTENDEQTKYGMLFHMPSNRMPMRWSMNLEKYSNCGDAIGENEKGETGYELLTHPKYYENHDNLIYPIGFQPFMRCSMQHGYGIYMRKAQPLQEDIGFQKLRFRHSEELSRRVFERMDGGKAIYPHEGLVQTQFIIDEIKKSTVFSKVAFYYALKKSQYYRIVDEERCLQDLSSFKVKVDGNDKTIEIIDKSPWKISSGRRKKIDALYQNFSAESFYGIRILERQTIPGGAEMFEPWMQLEYENSPGAADYESRAIIGCANLWTRDCMNLLALIKYAKLPDFM